MPAPLEGKPEPLPDHLQEVVEAFWLLSESRPVGFGSASGITAVDALAVAAAWAWEPTWFLPVIRELDRVFLRHLHEAAERRDRKKKP